MLGSGNLRRGKNCYYIYSKNGIISRFVPVLCVFYSMSNVYSCQRNRESAERKDREPERQINYRIKSHVKRPARLLVVCMLKRQESQERIVIGFSCEFLCYITR